jgi:hypothetical protein
LRRLDQINIQFPTYGFVSDVEATSINWFPKIDSAILASSPNVDFIPGLAQGFT